MDFYTGQIIPVAIGYAPKQTAMCQGQSLPINQNSALFTLLGTAFGGDGSNAFNLPNVAGRTLVGQNIAGRQLMGAAGGEASHVLTTAEIPSHNHTLNVIMNGSATSSAAGAMPTTANQAAYGDPGSSTVQLGGALLSPAGSGQSHNNMQPSTPINFTIVLYGMFPSRA